MGNGMPAGSMRRTAVEVSDTEGNAVNVLTVEAFQAFLDSATSASGKLDVTQLSMHNTFKGVLKELKKIEFHLSIITENKVTNRDVEDY